MSGNLRPLLTLMKVSRWRLTGAVSLGALTVIFGVGLMASAGYLISKGAERPPILSLMVAIVVVQFFGLGRPVVRYLERLACHDMALRMLGGLRRRFYRRIEPLAPAELDCYRKGDLLSRMVADVDAQQNLYLRSLQPVLVALLAGAVSIGAATALLPLAGAVLAAGLVIAGLLVPALSGWLGARASRRQAAARGELSAELVELMRAGAEVVAFGGDAAAMTRVQAADSALVKLARRDALAAGMGDGVALSVAGVTVAGVLALAVSASAQGHLDRILIATLALLALASFEAVTPLGAAARELFATLAAGQRLLEVIDRESVVRDPVSPALAPVWPFEIALEDVRARYPHQPRPALDRLSLTLEPGERVALVGPSGAGKTTVVNMLLRFLDPEHGCVRIGGRDLRELSQEDIRRSIAVAGQESHLFLASIRDNVRLAKPRAHDWEIEQALRRARIWDWVMRLPEGLDTHVGEEGRELSGGQRQRITLARALLADAPVLVLDEPTAHLDPITATELIRDVFSAAREKTVLLITHRREGLELVDRVLSLHGG
jgi:thiol reductant ABC exporter CydC subunit